MLQIADLLLDGNLLVAAVRKMDLTYILIAASPHQRKALTTRYSPISIWLSLHGERVVIEGHRLAVGVEVAAVCRLKESGHALSTADGIRRAKKHGASGAGILSSLVGADGLVALPEEMTELDAGSMVEFLPFSEVLA